MKNKYEYECQDCGKQATINLQNTWSKWSITNDEKFERVKEWEGDENSFYCEDCYEKEMSKTN